MENLENYQTYCIEIIETHSMIVKCFTNSEANALAKIKELYNIGNIILTADEWLDTEMKIYNQS